MRPEGGAWHGARPEDEETYRVPPTLWLHEVTGPEGGWLAWDLRYMGFATWSSTREGVLARAPERLEAHLRWLAGHGLNLEPARIGAGGPVAQTVTGNEVLFDHDRGEASPAEVGACAELLGLTRADLLEVVEALPNGALDWDPPYAAFGSWARWRTVRQVLTHVALTEVGYYLPAVGHRGPDPEELRPLGWREQLRSSRERTLAFLSDLAVANDRARVSQGEESWSVRKVLRRLVWHELLHTKSIRRIGREHGGGRG